MTRIIIIILSAALTACGQSLPPDAWMPLYAVCKQHGGDPYITRNGNAFTCVGKDRP